MSNKKITGVTIQDNKENYTINANKEVILCGGTFNSPHLLLL